jgi:hypothetical protein
VFAGEAKHGFSIAEAGLLTQAGWSKTLLQFVGWLSFGWRFGVVFFACAALLVVALLGWPFLGLLVVYWRCPCAGRHLLSLPPQRK